MAHRGWLHLAVLCLSTVVYHADCYPTGAPTTACQQMVPYHPATTTSGTPPFVVNVSRTAYTPEDTIHGVVYSPSGVKFKGFLIEARLSAPNASSDLIGQFSVTDNGTHTICGKDDLQGLTHSDNTVKTSVQFTWKAPARPAGDIHFRLTVVESYNVSRFWVGIYSPVVQDCSLNNTSPNCKQSSTVKPGKSSANPAITSTTPPNKIPYDPGCGTTKSCFPSCPNGCDYLVTWEPANSPVDGVHFEVKMRLSNTENVWVALGLSPMGVMNQTNVMACLSDGSIQSSFNDGYSNVVFKDNSLGLSNKSVSIDGNVLACSFVRRIDATDTKFWDLTDSFYLLVGTGPAQNGTIHQHGADPVRSDNKISFLARPTTGTTPVSTPTTMPSGKKITYDPDCGSTKGCFPGNCKDGCDYLVTWQKNGKTPKKTQNANFLQTDEAVRFSVSMVLNSMEDVWVAIGLSRAGQMDQTNVAACLSENGGMSMQSAYTRGHALIPFKDKTMGLSDLQAKVSGDVLSCSFTREVNMNHTDFWDLTHQMYLLVGTGPVLAGTLMQHDNIPIKSENQIDFLSNTVAGQSTSATVLIKVHGSFMVIAWLFCSSVGIVVARHGKSLMGSKLLCNLKYWFVIHRKLMVTTALFAIAAFAAIFVEKKGFQTVSVEGKAFLSAHPYLGIIATALTVLNPIMALFRPSPDHKQRYIFNMAHFSVGTLAHVISVITIGFGVSLPSAMVHEAAKYVLYAYGSVFVCVQVILELYNRHKKNASTDACCNTNAAYSRKVGPISGDSEDTCILRTAEVKNEGDDSFLVSMLLLHSLLMFASAGLIVFMICSPTSFSS